MTSIPSARAGFLRRLGYYAVGLAVGFVMLGMFQNLRSREHAARQASKTAQSASAPDSSEGQDPKSPGAEAEPPAPLKTGSN